MPDWSAYRPQVIAEAVRQPDLSELVKRARRRRRRRQGAIVSAVVAVLAVSLLIGRVPSFLASPQPASPSDLSVFEARAEAAISAYQRSGMAFAASRGFVPLQELTVLTAQSADKPGTFALQDTFALEAQYQAFLHGRFTLVGSLTEGTGTGDVVFADDSTTSVPIVSARAAYAAMDRSDPAPNCQGDECLDLVVTSANLGTVPLTVDRGQASVPAWIFTVVGLRAPIARVAVASSPAGTEALRTAVELLPDPNLGDWSTRVERVTPVGGTRATALGLRLEFTGGQCDLSRTGAAHEDPVAVVVAVNIVPREGGCPAIGIPATYDVNLHAPVGERVVLLVSGQPVP